MRKSKGYSKASASLLALLFAAGLLVGGLVTYYINFQEINSLSDEVAALQNQVSELQGLSEFYLSKHHGLPERHRLGGPLLECA